MEIENENYDGVIASAKMKEPDDVSDVNVGGAIEFDCKRLDKEMVGTL